MSNNLSDLFDTPAAGGGNPATDTPQTHGEAHMLSVLRDENVAQIIANSHRNIFYTDHSGTHQIPDVFASHHDYTRWINTLLPITDVGYNDVNAANTSIIEGSFDPARTDLHGSIHICTKEVTRTEPVITIRKQPRRLISLDDMFQQSMLDAAMRTFLEQAVRGRLNIVVAGGSGAGKTTLARALSHYINPNERVVSVEEIDELHLQDRLPNVASLTTYRHINDDGAIIRRTELGDLVRESLRMRPDRIWVGETRGEEAHALIKACNSGHDGSCTTLHADSPEGAIRQLVSYVMEAGVTEEVAREQVSQAFHLVVQIKRTRMGRRVVSDITELEPVREGNVQRRNPLVTFDEGTQTFQHVGQPTKRIINDLARNGVNYDDIYGPRQ